MGRTRRLEAMLEGREPVEEGSISSREWTKKQIDDELRDNGFKIDVDGFGYAMHKWLRYEMEMSLKIARGKFVVGERTSEPNGQLSRGVVSYIAESTGSAAVAFSSNGKRIAGVELNLNNLHPAYVGQEVTVIAKPLKKNSSIETWEITFERDNVKRPSSSTTESHGERLRETVLIAIARLTLVTQSSPAEPKSSALPSKL